MPVSESARTWLNKRFGEREIYIIGLDAAVALGHPAVISTALILGTYHCFVSRYFYQETKYYLLVT